MNKQELKAFTKQWIERYDPVVKFKKSPLNKKRQKFVLARIKASKQRKLQNCQLRRKGLL